NGLSTSGVLRSCRGGTLTLQYAEQIKHEMDKIYFGQLRVICLVVAGYYGVISAMHFVFLPPDLLLPVASTSSLTSLCSVLLWYVLRKHWLKPKHTYVAFVPILSFALVTIFSHIYLSGEQHQLTNAALLQYGLSLVTLSRRVFAVFSFLITAGFIASLILIPGDNTAHFGFLLFAVLLLSIMGFVLRHRALVKSVRLRVGSRVKARNLATATREVRAKMIEVQQANEARDVFLANVTHELRTPLTGVLGMLDLMETTGLNKDKSFMVTTARKSANFLLNIVNDLLDFSKLEAGKMELVKEPINLIEMTEDVIGTFEANAKAKGLALSFQATENMPMWFDGDRSRINQILLNLVSNAVKLTDKGNVIVTLQPGPDWTVIWKVTDTGCGIPVSQQEKLFNRFEQMDSSATRTTGGTGIGLAIVQELISLMGGTISVNSAEGEGTCFAVALPLTEVSPPEPDQVHIQGNVFHSAPQQSDIHVLVAEDNEINQILVQKILDKLGIRYTLVPDGQQAVEAATAPDADYALIFLDVQMPVMDGITATKIIKERMETPPPIVAITANTMESDIDIYLAAGMDEVIGKPININKFSDCIKRLSKGKHP
ncbi:MAG: ATP-binding protein, partial [Kordiimonas sp.]